jgi:hypothetical protein
VVDPDLDFPGLARAQGCIGIGPVENPAKLVAALKEGVATVQAGKPCVVDVRITGSVGDSAGRTPFTRGEDS